MSGKGSTPVGRLIWLAVAIGLLTSAVFAEKKHRTKHTSGKPSQARSKQEKSALSRYTTGTVTTEVLNVREKPAIEGHRVVALVQGAQVKILGKQAGFYKIQTQKGIVGWVLWKYVEADRPERVACLSPARKSKPLVAQAPPQKRESPQPAVAARRSQPAPKPLAQMVAFVEKSVPVSTSAKPSGKQSKTQNPKLKTSNPSLAVMTKVTPVGEAVKVDPATYDFLQSLDAKNPAPVIVSTESNTRLAKLLTTPALASRPLVESMPVVAGSELSAKGKMLVDSAMAYRGVRYRRGASLPSRGFDCSGLVYHILKSYGMKSPRTAAELFSLGTRVKREELKEGDLVFFANTYKRGISHVGIYIGNGRFVHASSRGGQVMVNHLDEEFYAKHYAGARRIVKE